jgi:hypothetical protein
MEIYERRHPFDAMSYSILILMYMVLCLLVMARPDLLRGSFLNVLFYLLSAAFFIGFILSFGIRVRRYLHLCVKRVPALVLEPESLKIYTPFSKEPKVLAWKDLSGFETSHVKSGDYCLPVYKSGRQPGGFVGRIFPIFRKDYIGLTHLSMPEEELLSELNNRLRR